MQRVYRLANLGVGVGCVLIASQASAQCEPIESQKLLADDGAAGDRFGCTVSLDGDVVAIGAYWDDDNGDYSGSAYIFERVGGVWMQAAKLVADDGIASDEFGQFVSVCGDIAAVSAIQADPRGDASGAVYVFERVGDVWTQTAKLTPADGQSRDWFGAGLCVSGQTVLVGAQGDDDNGDVSGSAYVFEKVGGDWIQTQKLLPDDGEAVDRFGSGMVVDGGMAMIGAPGDDDAGEDWGSFYIYERVGGVWQQSRKLLPLDGGTYDGFGGAIALVDGLLVVGTLGDDTGGQDLGAARVFELVGGDWVEMSVLRPDDGVAGDHFGASVATNGEVIVVGSADSGHYGQHSGSVYVFERGGGGWVQSGKLAPGGIDVGDKFYQVAMSGSTALVGALGDENGDNIGTGAAHVFEIACGCPADFNGDGVVDTRDFVAFLNAWAAGDALADFDGNGVIDTRDFIAYLNLWAAGC